jgi:hypothetical protein
LIHAGITDYAPSFAIRRFMRDALVTSGYSGTPLPRKLGIKADHRVALLNAPAGFKATLGPLPDRVQIETDPTVGEPFDVILSFNKDCAELDAAFAQLATRLVPNGGLWIAWPKRASGVATDLSESVVRAKGLKAGLVDNKVCAVDETWSGLRFVIRLKDRPKSK